MLRIKQSIFMANGTPDSRWSEILEIHFLPFYASCSKAVNALTVHPLCFKA